MQDIGQANYRKSGTLPLRLKVLLVITENGSLGSARRKPFRTGFCSRDRSGTENTEVPIGPYSADIVAKDAGNGNYLSIPVIAAKTLS
jgi:hypothetical protein